MRTLLLLLVLVYIPALPAAAQIVEFDVPDQIQIAEGRLSVTFFDAVDEAAARAMLGRLGYEVLEARFAPVVVRATAEDVLTPERHAALAAEPAVQMIEQVFVKGLETTGVTASAYRVTVTFASTTPASAARAAVEDVEGLRVGEVEKRTNEVIVGVEPGTEEEAETALRREQLVRDVTYVAANAF